MVITNKDQDQQDVSSRNTIVTEKLQVSREIEVKTGAESHNEDDNDQLFKCASIIRAGTASLTNSSSSTSSLSSNQENEDSKDYRDDISDGAFDGTFDATPSINPKLGMLRLRKPHNTSTIKSVHTKQHQNNNCNKAEEVDDEIAKQAQKRQMTNNQELWNAITMLPPLLFNICFCLSGQWLAQSDIDRVQLSLEEGDDWMTSFSSSSCVQSSVFPNLHSIPPPTTIANAIATVLHSPCSIYYHLLCAYKLAPGPKRLNHWTLRLDQGMIHFMSFMISYATSANIEYTLLAMIFNIECMYRLFQRKITPRHKLYRMIISFTLPLLPLLVRGEIGTFITLAFIYSASGWLFATYPFGGWSHVVFHLVIFLSNPILCRVSVSLDADIVGDYIDTAAKCAIFARGDVGLDSGLIL